jgi:small subunit ribosomal protein S7
MSRRFSAPKRQIIPDAKYGDQLVAKFVNSLMLAGKRSTAEKCLYGAFNIIEERFKEEPLDVFKKALDAVKPRVEVKSRRVGGATYQVPVEVRSDRRNALAMRRCVGWFSILALVAKSRCRSASQESSWKPRRAAATP